MNQLPLIAILRGVTPNTILQVAEVLVASGFSKIEVPLNSPDALISVTKLVKEYGDKFSIGAGTVTNVDLAQAVIDTGANLIVTPNYNHEVVRMSIAAGCECFPGVATPTECFAALASGATGVKFFPISILGLDGFKAIKSVLPIDVQTYPVGGINPTDESMHPFLAAGATGFGLGSALYKPSMDLTTIGGLAKSFVDSYKRFGQ